MSVDAFFASLNGSAVTDGPTATQCVVNFLKEITEFESISQAAKIIHPEEKFMIQLEDHETSANEMKTDNPSIGMQLLRDSQVFELLGTIAEIHHDLAAQNKQTATRKAGRLLKVLTGQLAIMLPLARDLAGLRDGLLIAAQQGLLEVVGDRQNKLDCFHTPESRKKLEACIEKVKRAIAASTSVVLEEEKPSTPRSYSGSNHSDEDVHINTEQQKQVVDGPQPTPSDMPVAVGSSSLAWRISNYVHQLRHPTPVANPISTAAPNANSATPITQQQLKQQPYKLPTTKNDRNLYRDLA